MRCGRGEREIKEEKRGQWEGNGDQMGRDLGGKWEQREELGGRGQQKLCEGEDALKVMRKTGQVRGGKLQK